MKKLLIHSLALTLSLGTLLAAETAPRQITVDCQKPKGPNNHYEAVCVGAGRAGELLRKAAVDQLKDVRENCGFQYLRFHGLFHDDMAVYSEEKGKPVYNFQYVDLAYDAILDTGMKPFVELSFMPAALASGSKTVFWWKGNVTPPNDYDKWGNLIREFTAHMEQRHGRDEVKQWYFEVWNEPNLPNLFFDGTLADYLQLYDVSARAVKSVCADYRVGGPSTAANDWAPELIRHCQTNAIPLDFISTHTYGVRGAVDEFGTKVLTLIPGDDTIAGPVRGVRAKIAKSAMPALPLFYTEWSASYSSRDAVHDSYISAAFILNTLKRCSGFAQAMSYWTYTDVFEEAGPGPTPFHGGFGLINLQGLHKPSYYAYKFLHELGDTELECGDVSATVCRSDRAVQALVWNYTTPKQDAPDNAYFKRDLPAKSIAPAQVTIKNLPAGRYALKVFSVGYRRNDVYADFLDLGSPPNPTRQQIQTLNQKNSGGPMLSETVEIKAGEDFQRTLEMRENDVYLVTLQALQN